VIAASGGLAWGDVNVKTVAYQLSEDPIKSEQILKFDLRSDQSSPMFTD